MTFFHDLRHRGARVLAPLVAVAALLAACGGGTEQVQSFVPQRLLVLGDESGVIADDGDNNPDTNDGFKYSLNDRAALTGDEKVKCLRLPTPSQTIAAHYGFVFAACNPPTTAEPKGKTPLAHALGKVGAQADDPTTGLKAQIDGISDLGATDMVMVQIGVNDVIALYEARAAGTYATDALAIAEATRRGGVAATQINRVLATGARALVLTIPVMGKSPYAITRGAAAQKLITDLTTAFNTALRLGIDSTDFDGRNYGLVLADDVVAAIEKFPSSYLGSSSNVKDAVCAVGAMPLGCLVAPTAVPPITAGTHLWASDRHLGYVANAQIGAQALSRAVNNPF